MLRSSELLAATPDTSVVRVWQPARTARLRNKWESVAELRIVPCRVNSGRAAAASFSFVRSSSFSDFSYSAISSSVMTYSSRLANILVFAAVLADCRFVALRGLPCACVRTRWRHGARGESELASAVGFHQQVAYLFEKIVELEWLEDVGQPLLLENRRALPRPPIPAPGTARAPGPCLPPPQAPAPIPSASGIPGLARPVIAIFTITSDHSPLDNLGQRLADRRHNPDLPAFRVQHLAQRRLVRLIVFDNQDADLGQCRSPCRSYRV